MIMIMIMIIIMIMIMIMIIIIIIIIIIAIAIAIAIVVIVIVIAGNEAKNLFKNLGNNSTREISRHHSCQDKGILFIDLYKHTSCF